jgi:hypothetical protein
VGEGGDVGVLGDAGAAAVVDPLSLFVKAPIPNPMAPTSTIAIAATSHAGRKKPFRGFSGGDDGTAAGASVVVTSMRDPARSVSQAQRAA